MNSGARGVVFGRNVVQARDPERFLEALCSVVKENVSVDDAAEQHGIDA